MLQPLLSRVLPGILALGLAGAAVAQPEVVVTPTQISATIESGLSATETLTIENVGDALLTFDIEAEVDDVTAGRRVVQRGRVAPAPFDRDARLGGVFRAELQDLLARTGVGEEARVIVELDVPFAAEGYLSQRGVQQQRAEVAAAQDALLDRLAPFAPEVGRRFETVPYVAMAVDEAALRALVADPAVVRIHEDALHAPTLEESIEIIGAPGAWDLGFTGLGQAVAILDSGVDNDHPFLADYIVEEACFSNSGLPDSGDRATLCPDGTPEQTGPGAADDPPGFISGADHGTHVAGIAAGRNDTFSGVAREASIIAVQVFTRFNSDDDCGSTPAPCVRAYSSDIVAGLDFVYGLRDTYDVASANMSLGGGASTGPCPSDPREPISASMKAAGIAVVSSSGNSGLSGAIGGPACAPSIISVGSTEDGSFNTVVDRVSSFSNSADFLDLLAPGEVTRSSVPGGGFANKAGTSMASPHVAGAFALLSQAQPEASVETSLALLAATGVPITDDRNGLVHPRIQVDFALAALDWLSADPEDGEVPAGQEEDVTVTLSALGLGAGTYTGRLLITTNDPDSGTVEVPVTLTVTAPPQFELQVLSQNPDSSVTVVVNPTDLSGNSGGRTPITRVYEGGTEVTLIAPPSAAGNAFLRWESDGEVFTERTVTFTMDEVAAWVAVFEPDNEPPVANPDQVEIAMDEAVEIEVTENDSDPEGEPLIVTGATDPEHGTLQILEDLVIDYAPAPGFTGTDTFTYTISDPEGATAEAEVTVYVGVDVAAEDGALPAAFAVRGVFPNPTRSAATLTLDLPAAAGVAVVVTDLLGRELARLERALPAGAAHRLVLPTEALPSGLYLYRVQTSGPDLEAVATGRFTVAR